MKKLQNNFTTPEQSKRLLELGVPADSADCYVQFGFENLIWTRNTISEKSEDFFDHLINGHSLNIPCWSVGRLMEIYGICTGSSFFELPIDYNNLTEDMIGFIKDAIEAKWFDFSKLED